VLGRQDQVEQLQVVIGKLKTQHGQLVSESERTLNGLAKDKQRLI
jgi:hypothetical protein